MFLGLGLPWMMAAFYWGDNELPSDLDPAKLTTAQKDWLTKNASRFAKPEDFVNYMKDNPDGGFVVVAGALGYSVTIFCIVALICLGGLMLRRRLVSCGNAELGGDRRMKYISGSFFISLWFVYIAMSTVKAYDELDKKKKAGAA